MFEVVIEILTLWLNRFTPASNIQISESLGQSILPVWEVFTVTWICFSESIHGMDGKAVGVGNAIVVGVGNAIVAGVCIMVDVCSLFPSINTFA